MRLRCIGCDALARLIYHCAAWSPHVVDVELLPRGLHNTPPNLRVQLQARIDAARDTATKYDAIALVYGLCGTALDGLTARDIPIVIPRAHDCITLFLGARERYKEQFEKYPGTYWYALDYIERSDGTGSTLSMGSGTDTDLQAVYDQYVQKYGKDNADYLMEVMGAWKQHYRRAIFIGMGVGDETAAETRAQEQAARRGWSFERIVGDLVLIRRLLHGDWGEDFLVLEPGQRVVMSGDDVVIGCQP